MANQLEAASALANYQIISASLPDVHAISRLERIVFPLDAYSYLSLTSLLMQPGGVHLKAVDQANNLVGFVSGTPDWGQRIDWIITLCGHPAHQHQGLGAALLTGCEARLTLPTLALTVRASNAPAIRLYQRAGYQTAYVEARYYSDGEDGIVMKKRIQRDNL
jgi:ribosomal-protein-alanine N-acetyltransferase